MNNKYIVQNVVTKMFWLAEGKGSTHEKSLAYRYTEKELNNHQGAYQFIDESVIKLPVEPNSKEQGVVYQNNFLTAKLDNQGIFSFDRNTTQTGAVVVPYTPEGKIILISEYRPAVDSYVIGVVKGASDSVDELPEDVAKRELAEELGITAETIAVSKMEPFALAGFTKTRGTVCVARGCRITQEQSLDEGEQVEAFGEFTFEECVQLILEGVINDCESISAIMMSRYIY